MVRYDSEGRRCDSASDLLAHVVAVCGLWLIPVFFVLGFIEVVLLVLK